MVIGQPLNLEAQIVGFPSPEVKWFKDGAPLRPSKTFNFVNQPNGVIGLKYVHNKHTQKMHTYSPTILFP